MKTYKLLTLTLFAALLFISTNVDARGPSVNPITEVDIETERSDMPAKGYNFDNSSEADATSRVPANITSHQKNSSSSSYIFPLFVLMVLPFGIWYLMSKKSTQKIENEIRSKYLAELETLEAVSDHDHDDIDTPKAS